MSITNHPSKIVVLGMGNLLLKDEGIGVHVAQRLMERELPPDVEVMDGGTAGFALLDEIKYRKMVIVIDAVMAGEPPATIYRFGTEDIEVKPKTVISLHEVDFANILSFSDMLGERPEDVTVVGIEPKSLEAGLELSPEIEQKIPKIIELVMDEIEKEKGRVR